MALFARAPLLGAAFFAIAPLLCALAQNEIQMTLYMLSAWGRPDQNEARVIEGDSNRFGRTWVADWPVGDGPDLSGKVIGRAQGFEMKVTAENNYNHYYTSMNLVFNDESRYGGSTLQIIGFYRSHIREWSIVGGTGKFAMARGVAKYTFESINSNSDLYKVNVHAYYTSMDSTAISGGCNSNISEPIAEETIA